MEKSIRIWCTYHDKQQLIDYNLYDTDILKLFYTNNLSLNCDNINILNNCLCELVTYYYVWKNQLKTDYIGFCHYRRHFNDIHYEYIDDEHVQVYENNNSLENLNITLYTFGDCLFEKHLVKSNSEYLVYSLYKKYVSEKYNYNDIESYNNYLNFYGISCRISFIMTYKIFEKFCDHIFGFLDYLGNYFKLNWKTEIGMENLYKNIFKPYKSKQVNDNILAVLLEVIGGYYLNICYHTCDFKEDHKDILIYNIEDPNKFYKMYKLNIKTGIKKIINISNYDSSLINYYFMQNALYIKPNETDIFLNEYKDKNIIRLKENEYIDCIDSFNFNKGNYTIKQIADS